MLIKTNFFGNVNIKLGYQHRVVKKAFNAH